MVGKVVLKSLKRLRTSFKALDTWAQLSTSLGLVGLLLMASGCTLDSSVGRSQKSLIALEEIDPLYRSGDTIEVAVKTDAKFQRLELQYAADGENFTSVQSFSTLPSSISWTVPSSSTTKGRLQLVGYGRYDVFKISSSPSFRVVSSMDLVAGDLNISGIMDGTSEDARLMTPEAMLTIGSTVYISDRYSIRKIDVSDLANPSLTTIAGSTDSFGSVDGVGLAARFNLITGLATDGVSLFISDYGNHTIRKMDLTTSEVTTLAGQTGTSGNTDGTGTSALFFNPWGLAYADGFLYVSDYRNHRIRKVSLSGVVTTLAGSTSGATNHASDPLLARFEAPTGLATDGTSLFISDAGNRLIRKLVFSTGEVTTLSGSTKYGWFSGATPTESNFFSVRHLAHHSGTLYVADFLGGVIKKVDTTTGATTDFVGVGGDHTGDVDGVGGSARIAGVCGLAILDSDTMLINSRISKTIKKVSLSSAEVSSLLGPSATLTNAFNFTEMARILPSHGLYVDGDEILLAEDYSHTIRKSIEPQIRSLFSQAFLDSPEPMMGH